MSRSFSIKRLLKSSEHTQKGQGVVYNTGLPPNESKKRAILLIDPQNDFIAEWGSLSVPGAIDDSKRVAAAIMENVGSIDQIFVTLDTHQRFHIAHAMFWKSKNGLHPKPFTEISSSDVQAGKWVPTNENFNEWAMVYVKELEKQKKFKLTIWPYHCLVGSKGHAVVDCLEEALQAWEMAKVGAVTYVMKGKNALTEHYSAFRAEVVRAADNETGFNHDLVNDLASYDEIIVAGQAKSHCVNYSVRDLVGALTDAKKKQVVVLSDGSSAIAGYDSAAADFQHDMQQLGVRFITTADAFSV